MHKLLVPLFLVSILPGLVSRSAADEGVRAILEKAIRAQGGEEKLSLPQASTTKLKGTLLDGSQSVAFTMEIFTQEPDLQKYVSQLDLDGTKVNLTYGFDGSKGWCNHNGQTEDLDEQFLASMKRSDYVDHVSSLFPLLREKGFVLSDLGESKLEDRTVAGVKVASGGHSDVNLFFDQASGLLVKTEYRGPDQSTGKEVTKVVVLGDYRELDLAAPDEQALRAAKVATDGPALLAFLRRRTVSAADFDRVKGLVQELGDPSFDVRERASAALVERGSAAVPLLRSALKSEDIEVVRRAERCLQAIEQGPDAALPAAVRLIGLHKPPGAAEVLLAYLPSAPDETVAGEVRAALAAVAVHDGKPDPVLVKALDDPELLRRAAAAEALGKTRPKPAVCRLLLQGIKHPRKMVFYEDGKKSVDVEVTEVNFFTRLEPNLFARP